LTKKNPDSSQPTQPVHLTVVFRSPPNSQKLLHVCFNCFVSSTTFRQHFSTPKTLCFFTAENKEMVLRETTLFFLLPKTLLLLLNSLSVLRHAAFGDTSATNVPLPFRSQSRTPVRHVFASQESKNRCVRTPLCSDPTEAKTTAACTDGVYPLQSPHSLTSRSQSTVMACSFLPPCLLPRYHYGRYKTLQILMFLHI